MRVINGRERLVVCLSEYLPLCSVFSPREYKHIASVIAIGCGFREGSFLSVPRKVAGRSRCF